MRFDQRLLLAALVPFLPSNSLAQGLPPALVNDSAGDAIRLCTDVNADGDYNDPGELTVFYDDQAGAVPLTNNVGLLRAPSGVVFVTDTSEDQILRLEDLDGDGDAADVGEATVWFDGNVGNVSGFELTSARGMWLDADGTLWVASSNVNTGGRDGIYRLRDTNGNGSADDPGEQALFFEPAPGGATQDSWPTAVVRGADGALYYSETGNTGIIAKGVYRLDDANGDGSIDPATELSPFYIPLTVTGNPFYWDLAVDAQGRFYMADTGNDVIYRFRDDNGDGTITEATESEVIYDAVGGSLIWEVAPAQDGSLFLAEDQNPDRLLRLVDMDGDDLFLGSGEVIEIYNETVSVENIGSPKSISLVQSMENPIGVAECSPAVTHSGGLSGAIAAFGSTSVAANDVTLRAADLPPNQFGFMLSSRDADVVTSVTNSQGTLCLGGQIGRYSMPGEIRNAGMGGTFDFVLDLGAIRTPTSNVPVLPGDTWRFQAWFRDVFPGGPPTSNFTDAVAITFTF